MHFIYEEELKEYMKQKNKKNIIVEVVTINHSEIEITELHVHFINEKQTEFYKTKKNYRSTETEMGEVLLPCFKLQYDEEIVFGLKSFLGFKSLSYKGIIV